MSVSRRRFLKSGAIGAVSAGLVLQSARTVLGNSIEPGLSTPNQKGRFVSNYSRASFEPLVGSSFKVRIGENSVNLKLIDLVDYRASSKRQMPVIGTESFVLAFRAPKSLSLRSTTQKLEHPALGKFDLFMTGSKDRGRILYTAVINRIV